MRRSFLLVLGAISFALSLASLSARVLESAQATGPARAISRSYLGFDRNKYPGDAALGALRKTFSFCGYWLNMPPGETSNTWQGKRDALRLRGFGFLVLFNGRLYSELKSFSNPMRLGTNDAAIAVEAARTEGFPAGTIIFLDQEEGGRMLTEQRAYVYAWIDGVNSSGYRSGVYCSGIPAREIGGVTVITANDLRENAGGRKIVFFVYNDSCPPSPGCTVSGNLPSPQHSGVPFASIWQFAQSPRRREGTASCQSNYDADGNCYALPFQRATGIDIDIDSATSPDPSSD
ncbi:MAG TPA: glycoside hydrolase domain-containing protein [Candidatus Acidoferrales bacterium]|nr:glycoside hydrolase domain-containing protein [Candidatus Acidoferrales bacterium]